MHVLFDASAAFKRYSGEAGFERVMQLQQQSRRVTVAAHCKTEVASALTRQWREGLFTDDEYSRVLTAISFDFDEQNVVPISAEIERNAIVAMRLSPLRAMDALHVATAQGERVDLYVTADRKQAVAARALGLKTELIEA